VCDPTTMAILSAFMSAYQVYRPTRRAELEEADHDDEARLGPAGQEAYARLEELIAQARGTPPPDGEELEVDIDRLLGIRNMRFGE
jgi:hypothetical protein